MVMDVALRPWVSVSVMTAVNPMAASGSRGHNICVCGHPASVVAAMKVVSWSERGCGIAVMK